MLVLVSVIMLRVMLVIVRVIVLLFTFVCHWCLLVGRAVFWPLS